MQAFEQEGEEMKLTKIILLTFALLVLCVLTYGVSELPAIAGVILPQHKIGALTGLGLAIGFLGTSLISEVVE